MSDWHDDFAAFITKHGEFFNNQTARYCRMYLLPISSTEDILQDSVVTLLEKWPELDKKWLNLDIDESLRRGFTCNVIRNKVRNASRQKIKELTCQIKLPEDGTSSEGYLTNKVSPEVIVMKDLASLEIYGAVAQLPDRQRQVIELRYLSSLSNSEISRVLEISGSAVTTAINKAITMLRTLVSQELFSDFEAARQKFTLTNTNGDGTARVTNKAHTLPSLGSTL